MQTLKLYIKPEAEIVDIKDSFMLELSIHNTIVDDEAANKGSFDEDDPFDEYDSFFEE
jgi:hypothetical protein